MPPPGADVEVAGGDDFFIAEDIIEDNSDSDDADSPRNSAAAPRRPESRTSAQGIPATVHQILDFRRGDDSRPEAAADSAGHGPNASELTVKFLEFSKEAAKMRSIRQSHNGEMGTLEVRTFLRLKDYNLDSLAEKRRRLPGSIQQMFMFYSRIYEKLVGKQKAVDVPLFDPIDFNSRSLGFRAILDWAKDFKLCPGRVGRRELERIFATVHQGPGTPLEKFQSKLTYMEFLDFIALCGDANDANEPMDRSRLDGSRARGQSTRLERIRRLAAYLHLDNSKKVRLALHNAYRDVHFWKLSDGADFEKEARASQMRAQPQWNVEPLAPYRQLGDKDAGVRKYLDQFTWVSGSQSWEEFEEPLLDMGTSVVQGATKRFRVEITNRGLKIARVRLRLENAGPLRVPWRDAALSPGQSAEVSVEVAPAECGEWHGDLVVSASWTATHQQEIHVPTYLQIVPPEDSGAAAASRLPWHAPRPFQQGSRARISIDPVCATRRQLRTPTPNRSRPTSAASSAVLRPPRRASSASGAPPMGTRPCSGSAGATSRPSSGVRLLAIGQVHGHCSLPPPIPLPWPEELDKTNVPNVGVFWSPLHCANKAEQWRGAARPHSAPTAGNALLATSPMREEEHQGLAATAAAASVNAAASRAAFKGSSHGRSPSADCRPLSAGRPQQRSHSAGHRRRVA